VTTTKSASWIPNYKQNARYIGSGKDYRPRRYKGKTFEG
jgi:hypothetical protein